MGWDPLSRGWVAGRGQLAPRQVQSEMGPHARGPAAGSAPLARRGARRRRRRTSRRLRLKNRAAAQTACKSSGARHARARAEVVLIGGHGARAGSCCDGTRPRGGGTPKQRSASGRAAVPIGEACSHVHSLRDRCREPNHDGSEERGVKVG
jgi:hypothetical protein